MDETKQTQVGSEQMVSENPSTKLDAENETVMLDDMNKALDKYCATNPTTAAMTQNAGMVAQSVVSKLKDAGFSLWDIMPKIFAIISMIQKYGGDIQKIIDEFKQIFGGPSQE